jgi:transposase
MTNLKQMADFAGKTIYVGVDVHLKSWDVSLYFDQQHLRSFQQPPDSSKLVTTLRRDYPNAFFECAYEAGFSGFSLQRQLTEAGIGCIVVHAADVPQTDKGRKTKNDRRDSKRIGSALQSGMLSGIHIPDKFTESNRRLVRYRQQLLRDLKRNKARLKHFLHQQNIILPEPYSGNNWGKGFIAWLKSLTFENEIDRHTLNKMIEQVEILTKENKMFIKKIRELLDTQAYKETGQLLLSIPGIGDIIAATLLVEIGDIRRFSTFSQFNSFIGLCPGEHSSGEEERKGSIISRHHKTLRALMIEAAWKAISKDPAFTLSYSSLTKRMTGKRAVIRIARKLLHRVYHVWMKKEEYEKGIVK